MWKSHVEKKPGSAKAKLSLPHLPCGNQLRKLWNLFSTACRNCFSRPAHFPRISPQVFPFHSTIFPHSNTLHPLSTFPQSPHTIPVEKKHGICGKKGRFPLFRPTNTTTIFLFLCFLCFAASLLSHKDALFCFSEQLLLAGSIHKTMPACFLRKDTFYLSVRNAQKIKFRRNCALFSVHPGQTQHFGSRSQSKKEDDS